MKGRSIGEVVIKAVLDHRADGDLGVRKELLDRLRQQVRGRMADDLEALGDPGRSRSRRCVVIEHEGGIDELAVDAPGERRARETRTDAGCDFGDADGALVAALAAVRQGDNWHCGRIDEALSQDRWGERRFSHTGASRGNKARSPRHAVSVRNRSQSRSDMLLAAPPARSASGAAARPATILLVGAAA